MHVVAARGGSLHKAGAGQWLTRKEVHAFLHPPAGLGFDEAIWHAIARSYIGEPGAAMCIARSKIARAPRVELAFWREVARFFCAHPAPVETIDACATTWPSAAAAIAATASMGARWRRCSGACTSGTATLRPSSASRRSATAPRGGPPPAAPLHLHLTGCSPAPLADWECAPSAGDARAKGERFVVRQLKQAEDLVLESRALRHCVSSYAAKCIAGHASIWSLRRCAKDRIDRLLTIEVDPQGRAVQVRGRANRLAHADERNALERWAKARGIVLR